MRQETLTFYLMHGPHSPQEESVTTAEQRKARSAKFAALAAAAAKKAQGFDPDADPYEGKPWGEQQEQVNWLESRYDDMYDYYDGPDYD